jgi:hypothetical protein
MHSSLLNSEARLVDTVVVRVRGEVGTDHTSGVRPGGGGDG